MDEGRFVEAGVVLTADPLAELCADSEWRAGEAAAIERAAADAALLDLAELVPDDSARPGESPDADAPGFPWEGAELASEHVLRAMEEAARVARLATARQWAATADLLRDAAADPEPWVGPDPTRDPLWADPRDRSVAAVRRERADIAVRAAAMEIAVRLHLSESTVRTRAGRAETIRRRAPRLWSAFLAGGLEESQAALSAQLLDSLPAEAPDAWAAFDEQAANAATRLTPPKFRVFARALRERVHAESVQARHRRAAQDRGVWLEGELDGMATVTLLAPAERAHALIAVVDATARHLRAQDEEDRTLAQLRADALVDLVTRVADGPDEAATADGHPGATVAATIAVTVPALSLLGHDDPTGALPTLDGYGPIDLETARRLAAGATSWVRVLTHPVTGTVLDVGRTTYRVPADLRRWLETTHPTCMFPGCRRPTRECDIDHLIDWQFGGTTSADNTAPECEHHHVVKHGSLWQVRRDPDTGRITWTSPIGHEADADPPPF